MKKQILVVEDKSLIAIELQQRLQELGYLVPALAFCGEEAIEQAAALQPDLVLMDISLNGTGAAAYIFQHFNIPVIYLTGYPDQYTLQPAKMTEPSAYLFKPFEEKELHLAIKMALDKHKIENKLWQDRQRLSEQKRIEEAPLSPLNQRLQAAAQVSQQINAILEPEEIVQQTSLLLQQKFDLKHVRLYLFDETKQELISQPPAWQAMLKPTTHVIPLSKEKSLLAHTARTQTACLLSDTEQTTEFIPEEPHTRSQIAVPLIIGGRLLGLLDLQDMQPNRFVLADVDLFSTLAGQIAIALENARLFNELKSLDRLKNEFLASMSHELRTPLNSIIGYSELMLMGVNGPLNREVTEDLHLIRHSGQRLLKLVNNTIDFIHLRSQRMVLEYEQINLQVIFDQIQRECEPLLQYEPITLELKIEPDLPQIEADKQRLKQILMNLVENAIKFTKQGFVRLYAFTEEEFVVFAIEDTGIGIRQSQLTTIFEHFRQLDGSSTRTVQGSGLGLAITYHLVELHGGTIQVKSQLAQGSTFFVRLPIKQISHTDKANHLKQFTTVL